MTFIPEVAGLLKVQQTIKNVTNTVEVLVLTMQKILLAKRTHLITLKVLTSLSDGLISKIQKPDLTAASTQM